MLAAFIGIAGLESLIGAADAHANALRFEIAAETQTLETDETIERSARSIDGRLRALHLVDSPDRQLILFFTDLERIARRRNVQITLFRNEGVTPSRLAGAARPFEQSIFDVALEGGYPATLAALADLSSARMPVEPTSVSFARANGHVQASLSVSVVRLGAGAQARLP